MQNEEPVSDNQDSPVIVVGDAAAPAARAVDGDGSVDWTASEFVAHSKTVVWYLSLAAITVVVALLAFLITKDKITTSVILVVGLVLGIYGARKPKIQSYRLSEDGLSIANKTYNFSDYRSFAVLEEGAFRTLTLMPVKRFGFMVTAHYDPADEDKIINFLGGYLPMEERKKDLLDQFLWKIRF